MLFEAALAAFLLALLLGGHPKNLAHVRLRFVWLLFIPVVLSVVTRVPRFGGLTGGGLLLLSCALCVLRYGSLIAFAAINLRVPGVALVGAGGALNALVSLANGGAMPVSQTAAALTGAAQRRLLQSGAFLNYHAAGAGTHLSFLGDCIIVQGFFRYSLSVGDLFSAVGVFVFVLCALEPKHPARLFAALSLPQKKG